MLALILLLGSSLLVGESASVSMNCSSIASVHTREMPSPLSGRDASVAFLRIFSEDDHGKNSHACQAEYQLVILPFVGESATIVQLLSSDGDWDRRLSVYLDGFSRDGKRIFGIISEPGGFAGVFDYDSAARRTKLVDLKNSIKSLRALKCGTTFAVAGITDTGAIVLEPRAAAQCRDSHRWILDPTQGELRPLPAEKPVIRLYNGNTSPENQ